ncbi:MAG TPA: oxygenase MpaB family protein [Streptosporangiaceae bacterium]|jgi:uncharacterized protein (DUF2236 family)
MTADSYAADSYAAATDLVSRSAAAYVRGVPQDAADDGFFGPGSVTWRVGMDLGAPVAGLRALMLQALHPLAMAGVDQHSDWRQDPVGRLAATSSYLTTVSYGERAAAERVAGVVRRIHEHVNGTDTVTGQAYDATDPGLLLWVHVTFVDSGLAGSRLFGTPLSAADGDRYVAEMVKAAELVGIPAALVPATEAAMASYIESVRPVLRLTPAASESMSYLLEPPGLDEDVAEIWQDVRDGAVSSLPDWAREMYGYQAPPLTPVRQTEIKQALGMMDAVFIGEPGVLEARQRITLRMRAARR